MGDKEVVLPDYLKAMLDDGSAAVGTEMISSADSVPRISLKQSRFRFKKDGDEVKITADPINVIIVGVTPEKTMAKTFYINGYNPDSMDPPDCSSDDGVIPNSWASSVQSETCATCPNSAWGSAISEMTGKKTKACKDSKRLYIRDPGDETETLYLLNVTVASLKNLTEYGKVLAGNGAPFAAVLTEISFDTESEFPKIQFEFKGFLKQEQGMKYLAICADKPWEKDVIKTDHLLAKPKSAALPDAKAESKAEEKKPIEGKVVKDDVPDEAKPTSDVNDILDNWGSDTEEK